jgi:hypothetical protein
VLSDLPLDVAVLLGDSIDLAVEHVHIVVERVVLLLCLDESGDDFLS